MHINTKQDTLMSGNSPNIFHVMCPIFGLALLLTDAIHWSQNFAAGFTSGSSNQPQAGCGNAPKDAARRCQSPINICLEEVTVVKPSDPLTWTSYEIAPDVWHLTNNGQSVVLSGNWPPGVRPYLEGGVLPPKIRYNFHNVSFHWGPSDEEGSEHTFNNTRYALELQMVHIKEGLSLKEATSACTDDAMVIVAYLFEVIPVDNPFLDPITNYLTQVIHPGSSTNIPPFPLSWFYEPFQNCYYTYKGSLTHPPCSEVVTWIILNETLPISARQVHLFRTLYGNTGPMLNSSRPVQHQNKRTVYLYA